MILREMNLGVFEGQRSPQVFFQPRIEPWFFWHSTFNSLPDRYRGMSVRDVYNDLGVSNRYFSHFTGLAEPVEVQYSEAVNINTEIVGDEKTTVIDTPFGELVDKRMMTVDKVLRKVEFAVRTADDLDKLERLFNNSTVQFNAEAFEHGREFQGDRGQPQF